MSTPKWPRKVSVGSVTTTVYRHSHHGTKSGYIFTVAWHTPEGRQREKFADEAKALAEARLKANQLAAGRVEGAAMTSGDRDDLQAARKLTGSVPLMSALAEWAKARELTAGNVLPAAAAWAARSGLQISRKKVSDVITEFLAAKTKAKIKTAENHAHIFDDMKEAFGDSFMDSISAPQLNVWFARWESPGTRHTFRKHTVALWRWAQKQNYLPRDIKTEAEHTDTIQLGDHKRGTITPTTLRRLLALIRKEHPDYLAALVLSTFCGLRRGEIHEQVWEHVDLVGRTLTVTSAKKGTPAERAVPLPRAAVSWLMLCGDRAGGVCTNYAVDRIRDIGRTAGIELPENCFRHSFITYRCKLATIAQVADEAGNSPTIIRKHYRNVLSDKRPMRKAEANEWFGSAPDEVGELINLPGKKQIPIMKAKAG